MHLGQAKILTWIIILAVGLLTGPSAFAQTIIVATLSAEPILDGSDADWDRVPSVTIPLRKNREGGETDVDAVSLRAGIYGEYFFLFATWQDASEDLIHKPFVWNDKEARYIRGPQREDRFSIQFEMAGDYTTEWFSGNEFQADMWHWKSSRTNPVGLVHDKMTIISTAPLKRAYKTVAKNGKIIYLYRPSDAGDDIYFGKRYSQKEKDIMPKYLFSDHPKGSITDVKANGVWKNGMWLLEIKRKMDTGHPDDLVFVKGKAVKAGIGIFNHSETDDHTISETLIFQF